MLFRQLFHAKASTYCYLIATDYQGEALLIDPVIEQLELYQQLIQEFGLKLVYTLETHTHADHITASGKLRQAYHSKVVMGEKSSAQNVDIRLCDNGTLKLQDLTITAIYTPGHTDDSYCYLFDNKLFTGDTLLIRGTGRTDFQSGSAAEEYNSLFNKILKLPPNTLVYPAHDYRGMTVSTIEEERQHNPRLQVNNLEAYITLMNNLNLPPPAMLEQAVKANLVCGVV